MARADGPRHGVAEGHRVRDAAFRRLVQRIDAGPLHPALSVQLLIDGAEAMAELLAALAAAREEILFEVYILRDDRIGEAVRRTLADAVRRGVRVSVLADAFGSSATRAGFWRSLTDDGITVRLFPRRWRHPITAFQRDHRKLIVIDRAVAFTGGMNIGEEYGSAVHARVRTWRDTFIRVDGPVARELAAVFAEGWDRAGGPPLPGLAYVSWSEGIVLPPSGASRFGPGAAAARLRVRRALRRDRRQGRQVRRGAPPPVPDDAPSILVLDLRPGRAQRETALLYAMLADAARQQLWITTPYFAPPDWGLDLLVAAARRGADVRLLVPGRSDVPLLRHAAHGAYARLLAGGVRIWEYEAAVLHAKTLVVDGHASIVGSSNLDFRSFWLNAECNLLLFDDRCASALERAFLEDLASSREITPAEWSRRPPGHALLDAGARALRWAL